MIYYQKEDLETLRRHEGKYYMPHALFDTMQFKFVRLEVKWMYVALLNVMAETPLYDYDGKIYLRDDNPQVIAYLKDLANKSVDKKKVSGYYDELEENGLVQRDNKNIYLKKIDGVF